MAEQPERMEKQFTIQKIYVKDLSFETPNSPHIFRDKWEPEISMQMSNSAISVSDGVHEIVMTLTVTAKLGNKTAYLVEVQQAGIFTLEGFNKEELAHMAGSFCPNILFPYAREAISDLVTRGGFPQILLAPVNFDALYTQHLQQMKAQGQDQDAAVAQKH